MTLLLRDQPSITPLAQHDKQAVETYKLQASDVSRDVLQSQGRFCAAPPAFLYLLMVILEFTYLRNRILISQTAKVNLSDGVYPQISGCSHAAVTPSSKSQACMGRGELHVEYALPNTD